MTIQEGLTRHPGLGEPTPEMAFWQQLEWRDPLFHYDPDGPAALAMEDYFTGGNRSAIPTFKTELARRRYETSQQLKRDKAKETRHKNMGFWIGYWESMSESYRSTSLGIQDRSGASSLFFSPLLPLEQEQQILETTHAIGRSEEVAAYCNTVKNENVPKDNFTVSLPDGSEWVDRSYFPDLNEVAQLPALAAVLALSGNRRDTRILYVASSYGLGLKMMQLAGFTNVMGIDIDEKAVQFSQSQGLNAQVMDAGHMDDIPDGTFDIVVSRNFLAPGYTPYLYTKEGGINRVPFLDEQHRVARNGGAIVLTTGYESPPLSLGSFPIEDIVASRLQNAQHMVATGLVRRPMIYNRDRGFYPILIFQK